MNISLRQAIITVLAAIIIVGGYFFWQFISKEIQPVPLPKSYKIGLLVLTEKDAQNENFKGFKSQMEKLGYGEGVNIEYITKNLSEHISFKENEFNIVKNIGNMNLSLKRFENEKVEPI